MKKICVLSCTFPPEINGQSVMIGRLLSDVSSDDKIYVTNLPYCDFEKEKNEILKYNKNRCYFINPLIKIKKSSNKLLKFIGLAIFPFEIINRSIKLRKILKDEKIDVLIPCTGYFLDMPIAWLATKFKKIEIYPYIFDHYRDNSNIVIYRILMYFFEILTINNSKKIIVPNEFTSKEYMDDYSIDSIIIRNPCDTSIYKYKKYKYIKKDKIINIVYTGRINKPQIGAFRNLFKACNLLSKKSYKLKIKLYTPTIDANYIEKNINKEYLKYAEFMGTVNRKDIPDIQMFSDILFLPLSFESDYNIKLINTSAPGKTGEYLASGRPIIIHAPKGSFLSWYFRKNKCGLVVDVDDSLKLAKSIEKLINDVDLQKIYIKNGRNQAENDFDLGKIKARFTNLFK